jgi:hypothetical protein
MKGVLPLALFVAAGSASAQQTPAALTGSWNALFPSDVVALLQKVGSPVPKAQLLLKADQTFEYRTAFGGKETVRSGKYAVNGGTVNLEGFELVAKLKANTLEWDGFKFARSFDMTGKWVYTNGNGTDPNISLTFGKDGSFSFRGAGAESKGNFTLVGDQLTLFWTEVDGFPVQAGKMKGTFSVTENGFNIDRFRYVRGG